VQSDYASKSLKVMFLSDIVNNCNNYPGYNINIITFIVITIITINYYVVVIVIIIISYMDICIYTHIYIYTHVTSLCVYVYTYTLNRARILHAIWAMTSPQSQVFVFLFNIEVNACNEAVKILFRLETFHLTTVIKKTLFSVGLSYKLQKKETPQHIHARHICIT